MVAIVSRRVWRSVAFLALLALFCPLLSGAIAPFSYSNDFDLYGRTPNDSCGIGGVCAAVATINSFIYLQNLRPDLYGTNLVPDVDMNGVATTSRNQFALGGWTVIPHPSRQGYYSRPGDAYGDFIDTKMDWIEDRAPGVTTYEVMYSGATTGMYNGVRREGVDGTPTIAWLAEQIMKGQDVEFFVQGTNFFHAMTLIGVQCSDPDYNTCSITYQDPNDPTNTYNSSLSEGMNGLTFNNVIGSSFMGEVTITGAFAESPVPEPVTMVLVGAGMVLVGVIRRRARA